MVNIEEIYNYFPINGRLSTSGQPSESQLSALAAAGCEVVINLGLQDDPRYALPDEKGLVESLGMEYDHIPVLFDNPNAENLWAFFKSMEAHKERQIHVHCAANMRVTAFLGLYNMIELGMPHDEAFRAMSSVWEPDEVWASFISNILVKSNVGV